MKPFDFKYGRKQETDDEKEGNVIPMEESITFGSFQQEKVTAEMEEVIFLKSSMVEFSTNLFVSIDKFGGARMKAYYSYVCGIQEVDGGE
ncbi:hypothetical protein AVEN_96078-1 [Araneus ventricosus]|uniref:Uncharacterized protein n=1 Tax=Araneus ventricosus TaxID=182803 RepID=A0A4Y2B478_ARAVE|nr:hypothetical protein AVEN_96078-1 [Araneus ventricosus]